MYKTQSLSENRVGFEGSASELMECSHTTASGAGIRERIGKILFPFFYPKGLQRIC